MPNATLTFDVRMSQNADESERFIFGYFNRKRLIWYQSEAGVKMKFMRRDCRFELWLFSGSACVI